MLRGHKSQDDRRALRRRGACDARRMQPDRSAHRPLSRLCASVLSRAGLPRSLAQARRGDRAQGGSRRALALLASQVYCYFGLGTALARRSRGAGPSAVLRLIAGDPHEGVLLLGYPT